MSSIPPPVQLRATVERLVRQFAPNGQAEQLLDQHRGVLEQLVMQVHLECAMLVAEAHGQVSYVTHLALGPHASEAVHNVITNLAGRILARTGMTPSVLEGGNEEGGRG